MGTTGSIPALRSTWARSVALAGPAFAVSIGYMDPGNWATDLAAGAFGFRLLWVILAANAMALVLQLAVTNFTLEGGVAFAEAIALRWPKLKTTFWVTFQSAAIATDLAEFTGIVLGIMLVLHVSVPVAVALGGVATFSLLFIGKGGGKALERALIAIVALICVAFITQLRVLHLDGSTIVRGAVIPEIPDRTALLAVIGIVGATVMPHNLFLHSALVREAQLRDPGSSARRTLGPFFSRETFIALNIAALVNGGILILGASLGKIDGSVESAYRALLGTFGPAIALAFALALMLSGLAASATATLSGDYIFRAFSSWHLPSAARRFITLVPAAIALLAGVAPSTLLIWSQVALAFVLPIAVVPLLVLMTRAHASRPLLTGAYAAAGICIGFDGVLLATFRP